MCEVDHGIYFLLVWELYLLFIIHYILEYSSIIY